jgi:hypothetical protein
VPVSRLSDVLSSAVSAQSLDSLNLFGRCSCSVLCALRPEPSQAPYIFEFKASAPTCRTPSTTGEPSTRLWANDMLSQSVFGFRGSLEPKIYPFGQFKTYINSRIHWWKMHCNMSAEAGTPAVALWLYTASPETSCATVHAAGNSWETRKAIVFVQAYVGSQRDIFIFVPVSQVFAITLFYFIAHF